jgi:hypothetical protein
MVTVSAPIHPATLSRRNGQEGPAGPQRRPTYQLQHRRCGKAHCRTCREGPGHGPYWYAYWRGSDGKLRSRYVGKVLPEGARLSPRQRDRLQAQGLPSASS